MRVLASYLFPICIGYGYGLDSGTNVARAYQSKKKKEVFLFQVQPRYVHDMVGYVLDTGEERKGKKIGKQRDLGRNKYCHRSLQVLVPIPSSSPHSCFLVFLLICFFHLLLCLSPYSQLFLVFVLCALAQMVLCVFPTNTAIIKSPAVNYSQRVHLFISFLFPKKDSTIIISALNGY